MRRSPWRHGVGTLDQAQIIAFFWTQVRKGDGDACWQWTGRLTKKGYGVFGANNKTLRAHVFSFTIHKGPTNGLCVCHSCDNRSCVNPDHLWIGTVVQNVQDMYSKGRYSYRKGEHSPTSKLIELQVIEIRNRYAFRDPINGTKPLAKEFGVAQSTISEIVTRKKWQHI